MGSRKSTGIVVLFLIRLIEVFASGVIPSFIGVWATIINPNKLIWNLTEAAVFIGFFVINSRFLFKYIAARKSRAEFYVLNLLVYTIYCLAAIITAQHVSGPVVYSLYFANMRVFEIFGIKARYSIYLTCGIIMLTMLSAGLIAYRRIDRKNNDLLRLMLRLGGIEPEEPEQGMSGEELSRMLDADEAEELNWFEISVAAMPDGIWSEDIARGDGSAIEYITPEYPENDFDEHDCVPENEKRYNASNDYTSDNLWDDIYKGKKKITEFGNDPEPPPPPPFFTRAWYTLRHHVESLRRLMKQHKKKDEMAEFIENLYYEKLIEDSIGSGENGRDRPSVIWGTDSEDDYDSGSIWSANMRKGRGRKEEQA